MQNELELLSSFFFFNKKLDRKSETCANGFFTHKFSELTGTYTVELTLIITGELQDIYRKYW